MPYKKLASGYTTGTCAQAATKAAMQMLFSGAVVQRVQVKLPKGALYTLEVLEQKISYAEEKSHLPVRVSCAVRKDSGDDPDITNGILVYSTVERIEKRGIFLEGGEGIGRVTKPGLDQPVGRAAINRVPRQMIQKEIEEICEDTGYAGGIRVTISIPGGRELAQKTFNPRLGVEGGLSILGTSGIVEPMSEQALLDTIRVELRMKRAQGREYLVTAPGNYGREFLESEYGIREEEIITCSNYVGQTIDMAAEFGFRGMVLAGHIGKLIKVSGGIMNTHSKWADCRMELLAAAALRAGISGERACALLNCVTTDEALDRFSEEDRQRVMSCIMEKIEKYLTYRAPEEMKIGALVYSNQYGILGKTEQADKLMKACVRKSEKE